MDRRLCCLVFSTVAMILATTSQFVAMPQRHSESLMAIPASPASVEQLIREHPEREFLAFPEPRENPIRLFDGIPEIWTQRKSESLSQFEAPAQPGEYFVFQVGVFAHRNAIGDLSVHWTALKGKNAIPASAMTCFQTEGIDHRGRPLQKKVGVRAGHVQPLWFGVQIPENASGRYRSRITLIGDKGLPTRIDVVLIVAGLTVENRGFDRGKSQSRLAWLNTTLGVDPEVTRGFVPVRREERTLHILGRSLTLGASGLPAGIRTFFEPSNQFLVPDGEPLLTDEMRFIVEQDDGSLIRLRPGRIRYTVTSPSAVAWRVANTSPSCELICTGRLEYDGFVAYELLLRALKPLRIRDIRLEIPMTPEKATYMMGLHHEGGVRTPDWSWSWDTTRHQDALWVGAVNGGLRLHLKGANYVRPLINLYYAYGPLRLPESWGNGGRGGVRVRDEQGTVKITAYAGSRSMQPGESVHFDCEMLLTPFRPVDREIRFQDRYFHGSTPNTMKKLDLAAGVGANIVNIHHAEDIYPFINYPYLDENVVALQKLVHAAHARAQRLKLYYTTRELTKNLPEFWALFSLNGEVIFPGPGSACSTIINPHGPDPWLKKNLKENYIPAWLNTIAEGPFKGELDLSVITTPDSRLNNFYIGGLDWMLSHLGIDGVYIDDSALDRVTLRRARKLIDHHRSAGRIDFHTWNHFNAMAGWTNCLNLYMDLLPYIDLVWVGEMRNYDRMPDHWLIEVSGIPFGLTGQMLEGGGNPWRGMVYGITNRAGWSGDPPQVWGFWDEHRIQEKRMIGYWDRATPVTTTNDLLKTTVYAGNDECIIAVGNWGSEEQSGTIQVDWKKLGFDPSVCRISVPFIPKYQDEQKSLSLTDLRVPAKKGFLIVVKKIAGG